ncbi:MAG: hypothetical protein ABI638_13445 [Ignavibacteriota bacterium]
MSGKIYIVSILLFVFLLISSSFSQNQITVKPAIGLYLYNSENSLKVMGDKNYLLNYGFEVSYEKKDLYGCDIKVDYSYIYSSFDNILEFEFYDPSPDPIPNRFFYSDVALSLHNFDLSLKGDIDNYFSYGFGPSFSFINRAYAIDRYDFIDRLASFAIGLNSSIDVKYPLTDDEQYLFLIGSLKFRYLYGLLYDKGLRDLSNYNQHFLTANFTIGLGYNF